MKKIKKIKIKLKKDIYKKYSFYEIIKIIFGNLIRFIHNYLANIFILYLLLFSKNFTVNIIALALVIFIFFSWYILNCCILTLFEQYILNEKKDDTDKSILKNYIKINMFGTEVILFNRVIYSKHLYISIILIILFLIKLIYLYNNK